MKRLRVAMAAVLVASVLCGFALSGVARADTGPDPAPLRPDQKLLETASAPLPGDRKALEQELALPSSVQYRILTVDSSGDEGKTAFLDNLAATWGEPQADTLILVIFAEDHYDIRFYMGANFRQEGVTVAEMLKLLQTAYFPQSQQGNVAGGLARLVAAVNDRIGFVDAPRFPVVDARVTPAVEQALTRWAYGFLSPLLGKDQPDNMRLSAWGLSEIKVVEDSKGQTYQLVYDVLPAVPNSVWVAASGQLAADGWVKGKVQLLRVTEEGGELKVTGGMP